MSGRKIGLLHPGEMGASVGGVLVAAGNTVMWTSHGRSEITQHRAETVGLMDIGDVTGIIERSEIIFSICPPHAALELARLVSGFKGVFVDANAISPAHARDVAAIIEAGGGHCVDGGIIGLPVGQDDWTRLYLSGPDAKDIAGLFAGTAVEARAVSEYVGEASALKMAYAAWTKGTFGLLLAVRSFAHIEGIEDALLAEWQASSPDLADRSLSAAQKVVTKGWRWVGEMAEIASSFSSVGLPEGFHNAAGEIFARSPRLGEDAMDEGTLKSLLIALGTSQISR